MRRHPLAVEAHVLARARHHPAVVHAVDLRVAAVAELRVALLPMPVDRRALPAQLLLCLQCGPCRVVLGERHAPRVQRPLPRAAARARWASAGSVAVAAISVFASASAARRRCASALGGHRFCRELSRDELAQSRARLPSHPVCLGPRGRRRSARSASQRHGRPTSPHASVPRRAQDPGEAQRIAARRRRRIARRPVHLDGPTASWRASRRHRRPQLCRRRRRRTRWSRRRRRRTRA